MHTLDVIDLLDGAPFRLSSLGAAAVCLLAAAAAAVDPNGTKITGADDERLEESPASTVQLDHPSVTDQGAFPRTDGVRPWRGAHTTWPASGQV